jgi:hypothetical protein
MSPEYEGPEDDEAEGVAPRRVKHLIVLPGGAAPEDDASSADREADGEGDGDGLAEGHGQLWSSGISRGAGASAAVAQVSGAIPLEISPAQSLRLQLRVISRSVTSTKAPGMPFIVFASVLVGAAIFALVVLHVMVDQASFRMDTLESQVTKQQAQLRELRYAVSVQEAPGHVAGLASQVGLVPASTMQTLVGPGLGQSATATVSAPGAVKTAARR